MRPLIYLQINRKGAGATVSPEQKLWCLERAIQIIEAYAESASSKGNLAAVLESVYRKLVELREDAEGKG